MAANTHVPLGISNILNTQLPPHDRDKNNQSAFHQRHCHYTGHLEPAGWLWISYTVKYRSYLGIVLEHLIALHVVTLEHDDGSVETGDVQTEVIRSDFFIRCVGKHLERRFLTQPVKASSPWTSFIMPRLHTMTVFDCVWVWSWLTNIFPDLYMKHLRVWGLQLVSLGHLE